MLTLSEMADEVNRSTKTFRKYVDRYSIPHIRMGRDLLFDKDKVLAYLETISFKTNKQPLQAKVKLRAGKGKFAEALGL